LARDAGLPAFERVFSSGAPLPADTARALDERLGWPVAEVFGSSETGGIAWRSGIGGPWRPFPRVSVRVGDDECLLLDSPLLPGDAPRPFACADRVALRADGTFDLLGRTDGVVKVGGKRVSLREIEERLLALPGVLDAAALACAQAGARGEEIWAAVVAPGWTAERIRIALAHWLDPVAVPRRVRVVPALQRDGSGKLPRARLAALFERALAPNSGFAIDSETRGSDGRGRDVHTIAVTVPRDLVFFDGHFVGRPVLPGIVQLERFALREARRVWSDLGTLERVLRLKFSKIICPGTRIVLTLSRVPGAGVVEFAISSTDGPCASGTLHLRVEAPTP
jgi:3-hydroxymyristoyl/3-hydroxydecanoyl-(acyl carrier protein) dehydratase